MVGHVDQVSHQLLGLRAKLGLVMPAERELLGVDHAEVGAALLDYWQLPGDVVAAVLDNGKRGMEIKISEKLERLRHDGKAGTSSLDRVRKG